MAKHPLKVRKERTSKGKLKRKVLRAYKKGRRVIVKGKPPEKKPTTYTPQPRFTPSPASFGDLLD